MKQGNHHAMPGRAQRGATAIEFAIVFPLLFGVFWAIISYALPFFLYQVMNHATAETSRYALRIDPSQSDAQVITLTQAQLTKELQVLPTRFRQPSTLTQSVTVQTIDGFRTLVITLTYPGCRAGNTAACLTPALNLFGASIPNLSAFSSTSRLRLENS
ncbi:MAG: TadE family protein [Perlucidibaca sp.]